MAFAPGERPFFGRSPGLRTLVLLCPGTFFFPDPLPSVRTIPRSDRTAATKHRRLRGIKNLHPFRSQAH
jgi:hypothetical protein